MTRKGPINGRKIMRAPHPKYPRKERLRPRREKAAKKAMPIMHKNSSNRIESADSSMGKL